MPEPTDLFTRTRARGRLFIAILSVCLYACGDDDADHTSRTASPIAVLSAFPAEMAAVLAQAHVADKITIEGHVFRVGTLGGMPVVIGMTGIGLVNAANTTRALIEHLAVSGVVVSAVAGSSLQIGDVLVPLAWELKDGTSFAAFPAWLDLATQVANAGDVSLDRCTLVPTVSAEPICMPQQPVILVGGIGQSADPFGGKAFPCQPNGDDLYGCDVAALAGTSNLSAAPSALEAAAAPTETPIANDMETAAIAREAAAHGLPFIAFRALSDGGGDPLGLGSFLFQFPVYYHFAARNAAIATKAFLERLHDEIR